MPQVEYRIVRSDGQESKHFVDLPEAEKGRALVTSDDAKKRYAMVKEIVAGVIGEDNDFEHVTVWHDDLYLDMFVDETGVEKDLPVNPIATSIYRANVLAHEPPDSVLLKDLPSIHGDAVLFLEKVW